MNPCTPETVAAHDMATRKAMGQDVPDDIFQDEPAATQFAYGKTTNVARNEFTATVQDPVHPVLKRLGAPLSWLTLIRDAQPVLGEGFSRPLIDALQTHWEATQGQDFDAFKENILPVVEQMRADMQDQLKPNQLAFANDWLDYWENGGRLYQGFESADQSLSTRVFNKAMYPVRTAMSNLVVNNPFIASAHTFQVLPKAIAMYGPNATIRGLLDYAGRIGEHKLFGEDPELAAKGVYRNHTEGFNLVNFGDNLAKGIAYRVGEAAGKDPIDAVQNIAFQYRLGREPMIMWHTQNAAQVYLMRFAIESTKMYGGWLRNIAQGAATGDPKMAAQGAAALASFSIAQSLFTGVKSSVPAFLYPLLDQDTKDKIDEWDKQPWLDVLGHATGRDFTHYQPGGGFGLGVAQDIVNTDLKGGYSHGKKSLEAFNDQDYTRAGVEFGKGFFSAAQPLIPGVRITYKKLFDVAGDLMTGDTSVEDAPEATAKALKFPAAGNE